MSASGGSQPSNSGTEGLGGFWGRRARKFTSFLSMLAAKRTSARRTELHSKFEVTYPLPSRNYLQSRSHLQKCCERALDAHTIEDAIFWHSEIINELSVEIYSIDAKPWLDAMKAQTIADLSELQSRHGAILHRLTGILARNEQFIWKPDSLCKK